MKTISAPCWHDLPKQPQLFVSSWNVNKLLYGALVLFILESVYFYVSLASAIGGSDIILILFWASCLLFSFSHVFMVMMDAWSRFQNYKRVKDHLFQHGFSTQIAKHYGGSKCQRMALLAAAKELSMAKKVKDYYDNIGIKWYYFVPEFMIRDPLFPFRKHFWSRTFMEKYYKPKFDYRLYQKLHMETERTRINQNVQI